MIKKGLYLILALLSMAIGLYPIAYFVMGPQFSLLNLKAPELLSNVIWNIGFYTHISLSGVALFIGWILFSKRLRHNNIQLHRFIGKIYIITALIGALSGIYIGYHATGGWITSIGFMSLGIIWFYTTGKAYLNIRSKNIIEHEKMMIYSYAVCFAAVTLRLWMPFLSIWFEQFEIRYRIVSWLCWVPNLFVAYLLIQRQETNNLKANTNVVF